MLTLKQKLLLFFFLLDSQLRTKAGNYFQFRFQWSAHDLPRLPSASLLIPFSGEAAWRVKAPGMKCIKRSFCGQKLVLGERKKKDGGGIKA